jgi:hypothetical protein
VDGAEVPDQVADVPLRNPRDRDVEPSAGRGEADRELLRHDAEALALGDDGLDPALSLCLPGECGHAVMVP